jgi:hypothetical protein
VATSIFILAFTTYINPRYGIKKHPLFNDLDSVLQQECHASDKVTETVESHFPVQAMLQDKREHKRTNESHVYYPTAIFHLL